LASPGANVWAEVVSFVLFLKFGTIAFTGIGTCQLKYNTSAGPTILDTALPAVAFVIGASAITQVSAFNQTFVAANVANKAIVLHNIGAAEYLAGDGTAKAQI